MHAIVCDRPGDEDVLRLGEAPAPIPGPGEVLIRVAAAGVNRADLLQRRGLYPPPPGASPVLGLECAGWVAGLGDGVTSLSLGQRVMALLTGGGYAEQAVADAGSVMAVPEWLSMTEGAAVPEAFLTAHLNLVELGRLEPGQWALVHGGSGGVGTAALQLGRAAGARLITTAGSADRCRRCRELGAEITINYHEEDFVARVAETTDGRGVRVVLDHLGAAYLARNLECLGGGGRLVLIGTMGGHVAELDLATVLRRRLTIVGSTLRARPSTEKAGIVARFLARFGSDLAEGRIGPVVGRVLPLTDAAAAHRAMAAGEVFGKLVLEVAGARPGTS